jgi:hypothetical protein
MKRTLRAFALLVLLGLLPADALQEPGTTLTVTRKTTKLRSAKRLFAPAVAELREGDRLTLDQKDGAWLEVSRDAQRGWLHETDVSSKPDVRLSGEGVRESYSTSETSAARKGFNPRVEESYRGEHPALEPAFRLVDRLQAREVTDDALRAFLATGGLYTEER